MPPAPVRFSTTNCCLRELDRCSPTMRASASPVPPAPNGTMMRTGLVGQSCAEAGATVSNVMASAAASDRNISWMLLTSNEAGKTTLTKRRAMCTPPRPVPSARGLLSRVNVVLEIGKTLPGRLDRIAAGPRRIDRRLDKLHGRDVTRAVRKDRARRHPHDQLCADGVRQQRIVAPHLRAAVDAQPLRLVMQRDEQQPDVWIDRHIAKALEHAVAVVIGKCELGRTGYTNETGR